MRLLPEEMKWSTLILVPLVELVVIAVLVPSGCGMASNGWLVESSGVVILMLFFLAIYEKLRHEDERAAFLTILNGTAIFWWVPVAIGIWNYMV